MKNYISKLFITLVLVFQAFSCEVFDLDGGLNNPNSINPGGAELSLVMNNVFVEFGEFCDEISDETMGQVRMVAMTGGYRYDNNDSPGNFDFMWGKAYSELIPDINLVIERAEAGGLTAPAGIAKVIKAYVMFTLVDLFGDVPYSEAFQGTSAISPKADPGEDVYDAALALLDEAIADLGAPVGSVSNDMYYGGSASKWKRLANTLKLRYYLNTRLVSAPSAATINAIVADGVISNINGSEDFQFNYGTTRTNPDSRHPYYSDGYETGGPGWYMSNYYMWLFFGEKSVEDPRLRYYFYRQDCDETNEDAFTLSCYTSPYPFHWAAGYPFCTASSDWGDPGDNYGGYWGRDHGNAEGIPPDDLKRTAYGLYPAGGKFDADDCVDGENQGADGAKGEGIQPIILASFVDFMRAELALKVAGTGDARALLESAVRKSISKVMSFEDRAPVAAAFKPSTSDINDYVAEVLALYDAAATTDDKLNVVIKEYHLALFGNGYEAFNNYRRTGMPRDMQLTVLDDPGPFVRSFWYPASYVNRNSNAKQKDDVSVQVFWDTNPAGFIN